MLVFQGTFAQNSAKSNWNLLGMHGFIDHFENILDRISSPDLISEILLNFYTFVSCDYHSKVLSTVRIVVMCHLHEYCSCESKRDTLTKIKVVKLMIKWEINTCMVRFVDGKVTKYHTNVLQFTVKVFAPSLQNSNKL